MIVKHFVLFLIFSIIVIDKKQLNRKEDDNIAILKCI